MNDQETKALTAALVTMMIMLGDEKWIDLELDAEEWTSLRYYHQN